MTDEPGASGSWRMLQGPGAEVAGSSQAHGPVVLPAWAPATRFPTR